MIYKVHKPSYPIADFIESIIYYKEYNPSHSIDRLLPDGNTTLIIDLTESPKYIYDNITLKEIKDFQKIWFSGIHTQPISIPSGKNSEMIIINFQKGMANSFVKMPMNEFVDDVVNGEFIFASEMFELREELIEVKEPQKKIDLAERLLFKIFGNSLQKNPFIQYAVNCIVQFPLTKTIQKISNEVGYSQKHLIHLFKTNVGVTPKEFLKIIRFQKVLDEIHKKKFSNSVNLAYECGYYDQSHFIADFKKFSGFTPGQFLKMNTSFKNYVAIK